MAAVGEPEKKATSPTAEEIFDSLTLDDKKPAPPPPQNARPGPPNGPPRNGPPRGGGPPMGRRGPPRGDNMPPGRRMPPTGHRPTRSQEEALRVRRMQSGRTGGSSESPQRRSDRRPRRNSESSVATSDKPLTEEEKKAREAAREARRRDREKRSSEKQPRPSRRMDVIDQMDATSIFGTGLFHHDGPFDALNPHRNRNNSRRAPMQAFPEDSLNNVIGGSGPVNTRPDHATFMGNAADEAFKDYANANPDKARSASLAMGVFDPLTRGSILHGDQTLGLGTSTFLEGTPAPRTAIQRRETERAADISGDLQRKKSLAQRIRAINRNPREFHPSGRMTNPEGAYSQRSPTAELPTPSATAFATSDRNPFFSEFEGNKAEETISVRRPDSEDAPGGERRDTTTSTAAVIGDDAQPKQSSSLMARVKSLKGGRRTRPAEPAAAPPAPPGKEP